ncbi:hypothetical protein JOD43_000615 [Pullulanibacillus pueri]|uniref:Initiator Rep protein WH1 domain-containing protein n=1 Tax=Pullulanibacillus pueri TaxID=1437324 RepID=A0A8J2ZSZ3_9BACL|nr:RepB family plasmid replication initiator protein [Pullulanibacillus pueri]MBM7680456.1 hypothetical protein [Pullulanibacillus pueri]GGH74999.1 hypothetical protein GCM10007096_03760 [Pullulanibacillus pueri]
MENNPVIKIYNKLTLFDQKIINGIIKQVNRDDEDTKAYLINLIDFGLDHLNPSDITERLKKLVKVSVKVSIDGELAYVPLLTHMKYEDHDKKVILTFNSLLKPYYLELRDVLDYLDHPYSL